MRCKSLYIATLITALGCGESDPDPTQDSGSSQTTPEAGFVCPDPLPTATLDAGPIDPDAGPVMGGLGPPLVPETCWEATADWTDEYTCTEPDWQPGTCGDGLRIHRPNQDRDG